MCLRKIEPGGTYGALNPVPPMNFSRRMDLHEAAHTIASSILRYPPNAPQAPIAPGRERRLVFAQTPLAKMCEIENTLRCGPWTSRKSLSQQEQHHFSICWFSPSFWWETWTCTKRKCVPKPQEPHFEIARTWKSIGPPSLNAPVPVKCGAKQYDVGPLEKSRLWMSRQFWNKPEVALHRRAFCGCKMHISETASFAPRCCAELTANTTVGVNSKKSTIS